MHPADLVVVAQTYPDRPVVAAGEIPAKALGRELLERSDLGLVGQGTGADVVDPKRVTAVIAGDNGRESGVGEGLDEMIGVAGHYTGISGERRRKGWRLVWGVGGRIGEGKGSENLSGGQSSRASWPALPCSGNYS